MGIREIRRTKNITQKELADAIGVSETVVSRYERGLVYPPVKRLERMADYLNVSVNALLDIDSGAGDFYNDHYELPLEYDMIRTKDFAAAKRVMFYAKGVCELCGEQAPFCTKDGNPYLEAHFVKWLSEGGSPTVDNIVALCPNCHRKIHLLNLSEDVEKLRLAAKMHVTAEEL